MWRGVASSVPYVHLLSEVVVSSSGLIEQLTVPVVTASVVLSQLDVAVLLIKLPAISLTAGPALGLLNAGCRNQLVSDIVTHDFYSY